MGWSAQQACEDIVSVVRLISIVMVGVLMDIRGWMECEITDARLRGGNSYLFPVDLPLNGFFASKIDATHPPTQRILASLISLSKVLLSRKQKTSKS